MGQKRVILHVGPHKTGTTAIQNALEAHSDHLKVKGIGYETFKSLPRGAHSLADLVSTNQFDKARKAFDIIQFSDQTTIISSENFSRFNGAQASAFLSWFEGVDLTVVYYLRNPIARLHSQWCERVKHGYAYTYLEFIAARLARPYVSGELNPGVHLGAWQRAVGSHNLNIHLYDMLESADTAFLKTYCGLDLAPVALKDRPNRANTMVKSELCRVMGGYQRFMLNFGQWLEPTNQLCLALREARDDQGRDYFREFSLSMDSAVFRQIERDLIDRFSFQEDVDRDTLFKAREKTWSILSPTIWFEQPDLYAAMIQLRDSIHKVHGTPELDPRSMKP